MSRQLKFFDHKGKRYPHEPGHQMRDTSLRAASAARGRKRETQTRIMALLRAQPMTADELAGYLEETPYYVRPRVCELASLGHIEDSGDERPSVNGKPMTVWKVKVSSEG